jgi:hypothetical protein
MESDWEVEIGGDAPIIDACWDGFVDLRFHPRTSSEALLKRARRLAESANLPGLPEALVRLNGTHSPVWTSKCDVWPVLDADAFDADELDAPSDEAAHAWACYIDLLPRSDQQWITPPMTAHWCQAWCRQLRAIPMTHCRVDLIVRQAMIAPDRMDHGITAYLTACGGASEEANATLARSLQAFANTLCPDSTVE